VPSGPAWVVQGVEARPAGWAAYLPGLVVAEMS